MKFTIETLHKVLDYNPSTGIFIWKIKPSVLVDINDIAGRKAPDGRVLIGIMGERYRAHRLAWFYMFGEWPSDEIDHINGNTSDNRIENLRILNRRSNSENLHKAKSHNQSGYLGVIARNGRYFSQIVVLGKKKYLGSFDTKELAYAAYLDAKRKFHAGCTI